MSKNIEINFTYTKELAFKASKLYYDWDMKNSSKRYVGWLFVAMVQFGVVGALKHDSYGILTISTILVIYWYYGRWYFRKGMIRKYYDKLYKTDTNVSFVLKEDGLYFDNLLISWDEIKKVIELEDGIIIHISTNTLFFEKDFFKSPKEMKYFIEKMKKQGKL
ncbi:hypothetical protein MNB_SV-3-737 [hydrothermal vent metagenome]|uniref:YcxB-like C-terminal domain-containing protein n=1 Tax=hydrothermal vent metagenome TaxID=652676 RepID=A0A1W1BC50_9ZZZZ